MKEKQEKRHVVKALEALTEAKPSLTPFVSVKGTSDRKGTVPSVTFKVQSDPISIVGVNGVQVTDMLAYVRELFVTLDAVFPCEENKLTIQHIEAAENFQTQRTVNRTARGVEGKNEA